MFVFVVDGACWSAAILRTLFVGRPSRASRSCVSSRAITRWSRARFGKFRTDMTLLIDALGSPPTMVLKNTGVYWGQQGKVACAGRCAGQRSRVRAHTHSPWVSVGKGNRMRACGGRFAGARGRGVLHACSLAESVRHTGPQTQATTDEAAVAGGSNGRTSSTYPAQPRACEAARPVILPPRWLRS